MSTFTPQIGESFVGSGVDAAHVNTVLGLRDGPVGSAWASALASPSAGHAPFVAVLQPGLPVQPMTLFVNKAAIASDRHGQLTWGAAQAGLAVGVGRALAAGVVDRVRVHELALVAAVWVDPGAADEEAVFANNAAAALEALTRGARRQPTVDEVQAALDAPANPFFRQ